MPKSMLRCWPAPAAFVVDRAAKMWAQAALKGQAPRAFLPGVLRLAYVENTGAAFGILKGRGPLLAAVTGAALLALLLWLLFKGHSLPALPRGALWLMLGGAAGNFADRLLLGYVVDFLETELFTFPVFNCADICVCVAFALLAGWLLLAGDAKEAKPDAG